MERQTFGPQQRTALRFGPHKINLHQVDSNFEPRAAAPAAGSADLCFLVENVASVTQHLQSHGIAILLAPSTRTGARGQLTSVYCRDPDGNLIELSAYQDGTPAAQ